MPGSVLSIYKLALYMHALFTLQNSTTQKQLASPRLVVGPWGKSSRAPGPSGTDADTDADTNTGPPS